MSIINKFLTVAFLCIVYCNGTLGQSLNNLPKIAHHFIVVSHRGDHTQAPENTLAAYENAIRAGADYVEIDLRTTKDSQLVIMHDASVDRMTNGNGYVKDVDAADIRKLKVKDKTHPEWGEFNIPLFEEVLVLCKGKINIYLDFKNADPAAAYKLIKDHGMEKQVIVYINQLMQFVQWREAAPQMPLMISLPENIKDEKKLSEFLSKINVEILDGDYDQYDTAMIRAAIKKGCVVLLDIQGPTENKVWDVAISKGVQGLQTDHPGELIRFLTAKGIR